ncbi:hypothetical protein BDN72DRAFT_849211 [Pluteus cervinus]|uniref:Uncharacterized protein n=1 Tax=Pluteus cervinus TaxID=181527 RepID=A0ACD3A8M0_9AGAR|nr:hypothetical protein BDN72DRAFT_849211 [Pluteus cervinus]
MACPRNNDTTRLPRFDFSSKNQRPHWAIRIPHSKDGYEGIGKKIQVVGSPYTGFKLEIQYNVLFADSVINPDRCSIHYFPLGATDDSNVVDSGSERAVVESVNKGDRFENLSGTIQPPGVSSNLPQGLVTERKFKLFEDLPRVPRCQEWTVMFIQAAVKKGLLLESALQEIVAAKALNPKPPGAEMELGSTTTPQE